MKRVLTYRSLMLAGLVLVATLVFALPQTFAADRDRDRGHSSRDYDRHDGDDHWGVRVQVGTPYYYPAPVYGQRWVSGYYTTQVQQVLVRDGYYENRYVPPATETRYDRMGQPYQVVLRDGYYAKVWVAPVYERQVVDVWVPGYYAPAPYYAPVPVVGLGFSFGHH